jgi:hypothetical protein
LGDAVNYESTGATTLEHAVNSDELMLGSAGDEGAW